MRRPAHTSAPLGVMLGRRGHLVGLVGDRTTRELDDRNRDERRDLGIVRLTDAA